MKLSELENGMIVLVDHNALINDGRPIGREQVEQAEKICNDFIENVMMK